MKDINKIAIFGKDRRLMSAAEIFAGKGYECSVFGSEGFECIDTVRCLDLKSALNGADIVVLPIPAFDSDHYIRLSDSCAVSAEKFFGLCKVDCTVFGGLISEFIRKLANEHRVHIYDFCDNEQFSVRNAIPTAEGAVYKIMGLLDKTIFASETTVIGFGKTGKALASLLHAMQSQVTVVARNPTDIALAETSGYKAMKTDAYLYAPCRADVVFNTVPSRIIGAESAKKMGECIFIDLASLPGGLTEAAMDILGARVYRIPGIPSVYSPETAGGILCRIIEDNFPEGGI